MSQYNKHNVSIEELILILQGLFKVAISETIKSNPDRELDFEAVELNIVHELFIPLAVKRALADDVNFFKCSSADIMQFANQINNNWLYYLGLSTVKITTIPEVIELLDHIERKYLNQVAISKESAMLSSLWNIVNLCIECAQKRNIKSYEFLSHPDALEVMLSDDNP